MINKMELKYNKNNEKYEDGFRIAYFYPDGSYHIGEYCKTIEGFMIGFAECEPIMSDDDIPPFVSNEDLLNRCLDSVKEAIGCAIYKTDGVLIERIDKKAISNCK